MLNKKGQGGGGAAALIAAIVGLIVLYILFLPPEERAVLLNETPSVGTVRGVAEPARTLLHESPGTVSKAKQDEFEHKLDSFNLFARSEESVLKSFDSIHVESKRGSSRKRTFAFSVDPEKTSNVQLSFGVKAHSGRLGISVNGEEVYNGEAQGPVAVRVDRLEPDNVIELSAEEVGFQFWATNFYDINDFKITGIVEVLENLESRQTFIVTAEEANNLESAYLIYFVDCKVSESGALSVQLNDFMLSSSVPDCGSPARTNIDPALINKGSNRLRFTASEGRFLVDQVFVKTKLREPVEPVYFFEVNDTQYAWLQNNTFNAIMKLKFVDDGEQKRAEININNRRTFMDAKRTANFTRDITEFLVNGNNFIRITPETTLHIADLTIRLE